MATSVPFVAIPVEAMKKLMQSPPTDTKVYCWLLFHRWPGTRNCDPSAHVLAGQCGGVTRKTIWNSIDRLTEIGLLSATRRFTKSSLYTLNYANFDTDFVVDALYASAELTENEFGVASTIAIETDHDTWECAEGGSSLAQKASVPCDDFDAAIRSLCLKGIVSVVNGSTYKIESILGWKIQLSDEFAPKSSYKNGTWGALECERCGKMSMETHGHHILPRGSGLTINSKENIATLCDECHGFVHHKALNSNFEFLAERIRTPEDASR